MDEATFQKELSKYKVVRPSDYHKSKTAILKAKADLKAESRPRPIPTLPPVAKSSNSVETAADCDFWELLATTNASFLTAEESARFIEALREVSDASKLRLNKSIY